MARSPSPPIPPAGSWSALLAVRPRLALPQDARSVFLWGDRRVHGIALRTAALAVTKGRQVAILDADQAFALMPLVAMANAARVPPDAFLRQVHIARAFTCHQLGTLFCQHLAPLLGSQPIGLVMLLDPLTHFFDEDVTYRQAKVLFARVLKVLAAFPPDGPHILVTQVGPSVPTPRRRCRCRPAAHRAREPWDGPDGQPEGSAATH